MRTTTEVRRYVNYVVTCSTPKAVARNQVKDATDEDPALQALKKCINQGWIDTNDARAQQYRQVFHELTIVEGIVSRGDRIVVPAKLSVDFCGPMASGDIALIFYPQYARYPVVEFEESKSEKAAIPIIRRMFDTYGVQKEIKSDNGPPFNSHKFEEYSQEEGFKHR